MASPRLSIRTKPAVLAALDDRAKRLGATRSEVAEAILEEALIGLTSEAAPVPRKVAPKVRATAPPSKGRAHPAPEAKPAAAREALAQVETRVGVKSRLDMSSVPFVGQGKRPAYQRARDKRG